jgi:hypothetical protein
VERDTEKYQINSANAQKCTQPMDTTDNKGQFILKMRKDRKLVLKGYRDMANRLLTENKALLGDFDRRWEKETLENNIIGLKNIIRQINKMLEDAALNQFVNDSLSELLSNKKKAKFKTQSFLNGFNELSIQLNMARFSIQYSVGYDFYWLNDGTMADHLQVALGTKQPDIFGAYCEEKIDYILGTVCPYMEGEIGYNCSLLVSTLGHFNTLPFANSNISLMVVIEGITRMLCVKTFRGQNPSVSQAEAEKYVKDKSSIERLILAGDWKNDIPLDFSAALVKAEHIRDPQLQRAVKVHRAAEQAREISLRKSAQIICVLNDPALTLQEKELKATKIAEEALAISQENPNPFKTKVLVSLKVELQFLIRRFKDDRNDMVHGKYEEYNKKWKSNIYLSAIISLYRLSLRLEQLYGC